ncbi:caspase family protein [Thalassococcus profundi]|uniref:caspase family protein n=1 Tax=Thalassococcus profundi TaxID=2282382 RepID=UPI001313DFAF|nr:caspase family protein [Thalassococcus profundi]
MIAPVDAQTDRWEGNDAEARICTVTEPGSCVRLFCAPNGQISLVANGGGLQPGQGQIAVDGRVVGSGTFSGSQGFPSVLLDPQNNAPIFDAMRRGSRLRIDLAGGRMDLSLAGSSRALTTLLAGCTRAVPEAPAPRTVGAWDAFERRSDESQVVLDTSNLDLGRRAFTVTSNADLWGGDIRSGLDDPLLRDMTQDSCAALCLATEGCGAFTHNAADGNVCFLKTAGGRMVGYQGASSGVRTVPNSVMIPPPTRGPLPRVDEAARWRDGETPDAHASRVRRLAAPMARSCAAERADFARLAEAMTLSIPEGRAKVGEPLTLAWSGNDLVERMPVWVMARTPAAARFVGGGAIPLGPDAPNPFGIGAGSGETRALVALWARGAGRAGEVALRPLRAGPMSVALSLVAWLPGCDEEVELMRREAVIEVAPAPAELVIGTDLGRQDLTHQLDLPAHDRRIEVGLARMRISVLSDGTEIVERAGRNAALSATGRFLTVSEDGVHSVIDVLDGVAVLQLRAEPETLRWSSGDTVLMGSSWPWGKVGVAFPFAERLLVDNQITGPSCCPANMDNTHVSFDLENGIVAVRGAQGHWLGPVQGGPLTYEEQGNGYATTGYMTAPLQAIAARSLGTVAPIAVANGLSLPGGARMPGPVLDLADPIPRPTEEAPQELASLLRGVGGSEVGAFERIGLDVLPGLASVSLAGGEVQHVDNRNLLERPAADVRAIEDRLAVIGAASNWKFDLLEEPPGNYRASINCFTYLTGGEADITDQTVFAAPGALSLPDTILQLDVIDAPEGAIMVGRAECTAGATLGSLRGLSFLFVADLSAPQPETVEELSIMSFSYMGNNRLPQFHEVPVASRLYDRTLLLFTPRNGGIAVFDMDAREVRRLWRGLPSGDLLSDAYLTSDNAHVLQLNRDGGFHVHRIADGATVLAGRIVDDEVAVWTEDYRFDATAEAATTIDLRFPGLDGQFSFDRFDPVLYAPGLVRQVLGGEAPGAPIVPVPPELSATVTAKEDRVALDVRLLAPRGAAELHLHQDGILTDTFAITGNRMSVLADRLPGTRHAAVVAVTSEGLSSNAVTADLGPGPLGGTRRVLAVAVDRYADPRLPDLNYAKADADRLMRAMTALPQGVPAYDTPRFVGGRRADAASVLTAVDDTLAGLGKGDHAVLFFAGHGLTDEDGQFHLALSGTNPDRLHATGLSWSEIAARIAQTSARVTVLIDACHSGAAGTGLFATNDGAVGGLAGLPTNLTVLAASKGRQQSIEAPEVGGGLFTVALERVLVGERSVHDADGNGRIEASELARGVRRIVEGLSGGEQVPWMTRTRVVGDHALF